MLSFFIYILSILVLYIISYIQNGQNYISNTIQNKITSHQNVNTIDLERKWKILLFPLNYPNRQCQFGKDILKIRIQFYNRHILPTLPHRWYTNTKIVIVVIAKHISMCCESNALWGQYAKDIYQSKGFRIRKLKESQCNCVNIKIQ